MEGVTTILVLAGLLALAVLMGLLPVTAELRFGQQGWQADLTVDLHLVGLRFRRQFDLSHLADQATQHLLQRWRATGEPVDPTLQESVRRMPRRKLLAAALPALRLLGRSTRCTRLWLKAEVGGLDAMESALLAGALWGVSGMVVGALSRWVRLEEPACRVDVIPHFQHPLWRLSAHCILRLRLGKAIAVIVWLLRQELSRKEIIAWMRGSLRRKGETSSGRAPDPRPDEDGHGEPEGHGGCEHGDR